MPEMQGEFAANRRKRQDGICHKGTERAERIRGRLIIVTTPTPAFWQKRLQALENKGSECRKERKKTTKRRQTDENMGFATEDRDAELRIGSVHPHTPGVLYGCERKGVAGKGICKRMKTKGRQNRRIAETHGVAGERRGEPGTLSATLG